MRLLGTFAADWGIRCETSQNPAVVAIATGQQPPEHLRQWAFGDAGYMLTFCYFVCPACSGLACFPLTSMQLIDLPLDSLDMRLQFGSLCGKGFVHPSALVEQREDSVNLLPANPADLLPEQFCFLRKPG